MIWTDSPFAALHTYRKIALRGKRDSIGDDDPDRLWVEQVVTGARTYVRREVMRWISLEVWSKAWSQTYLGTGSYLGGRVASGMRSQAKLLAPGAYCGDWLGAFDFLGQEVGLGCVSFLEPLMQLARHCGWWLVHQDESQRCTVIASEKPKEIHLVQNRLHCEIGPALSFRDGTVFFYLHGVPVPRKIVETSPEKIPLSWWFDERATHQRQAIEQKIGAGRIMDELGAREIHQGGVRINGHEHLYRLLQLELPDRGMRRALRMVNPSTGEYHTEWVPREINTIGEALEWRNGSTLPPSVLT